MYVSSLLPGLGDKRINLNGLKGLRLFIALINASVCALILFEFIYKD
jgi:hypothetical protein